MAECVHLLLLEKCASVYHAIHSWCGDIIVKEIAGFVTLLFSNLNKMYFNKKNIYITVSYYLVICNYFKVSENEMCMWLKCVCECS